MEQPGRKNGGESRVRVKVTIRFIGVSLVSIRVRRIRVSRVNKG